MADLLTVAEALSLIRQQCSPLQAVRLPLLDAAGLVLAESVASDIDSPPHDKAMMDGYALRTADIEGDSPAVELKVLEEVVAGDVPRHAVLPGTAIRIMTGAPLPEGADAVVPVEQTEMRGDDVVQIASPFPTAGKHVMPRGESMRAGQVVLQAGHRIRSLEMALLAEVGHAMVHVYPRPRVAVIPTGNELVSPEAKPGPGRIRNSNGPMLVTAVAEAGATAIDAGVATDDVASLSAAIAAQRSADVILLTGGVSAGVRDLAPSVLQELGVKKVLHKVAVKPGKPVWFGVWPGADESSQPTYVFGLPGNPVSSLVCFQLFVRPLLALVAGGEFAGLPEIKAQLSADINHRGGRETYLPAKLSSDATEVTPVTWRGSADLAGLAAANALVRLPIEAKPFTAGETVNVLKL